MQGLDTNLIGSGTGESANTPMPVMRLISNTELNNNALKEAESRQQTAKLTGLSAYLKNQWDEAKRAKQTIETELLRNQRQRNGEYDKDKLEKIRKQGGTEIFLMLTAAKCRAAEAWINDIILSGQDDPWDILPSEIVELPEDIASQIQEQVYNEAMQNAQAVAMADGFITDAEIFAIQQDLITRMGEMAAEVMDEMKVKAEETALKMQSKIKDQFQQGKFNECLKQVVTDVVTFKAGFLKGPVVRRKSKLNWVQTEEGYQADESEEIVLEFERRSPFDIYPSPDSVEIDDSYLFDRQKLTVGDLNAMKGMEAQGYDDGAINAVIEEYGKGGLREWLTHDTERSESEDKPYEYLNTSSTIEALEYWGKVPGFVLLEQGFDESEITDRHAEYEINAWMIGRWIIKAALNPMPLGQRPYTKASYEQVAGSFWGRGVPELMEDLQQICNASARAVVNNLAVASGPQVIYNNIDRIPKGEDIENIYPYKIHQFTPDIQGNRERPLEFYQPNVMTHELIDVYTYFSKLSDDYTGIPAYIQGNDDAKGAGSTASGLSMIMTHASRGIKAVIDNIDKGIIKPIVTFIYVHNMKYDEDESIKGDVDIQAKGALSLFNKEQAQIRRNEFLMATNNPTDLQIVGMKGRAALLRELTKALDMPTEDIVPDKEQMDAMMQQQQIQAQQMQQQQIQAQSLDAAGNPVAGQDARLFN